MDLNSSKTTSIRWVDAVLHPVVLTGAFGFFVDMFDIGIFSVVRVSSLRDLGLSEDRLLNAGAAILNFQSAGMLLGGFIWGLSGDRRGRLSTLLGSIALYSAATIGNACVHSIGAYALFRFLAGLGLAGELGAAITLATENLPAALRGYGALLVPSFGLLGGLTAALLGTHMSWRLTYAVGGGLGLLLLVMRKKLSESPLFSELAGGPSGMVQFRDLGRLFSNPERVLRYLRCICLGIPIWFISGILIVFSPEIARGLGVRGEVLAGYAIFANFLGGSVGNLVAGILSEKLQSRKKALIAFVGAVAVFFVAFFGARQCSVAYFYALALTSGLVNGYFSIFLIFSAEQFGTNLRATASTTIPNFNRGGLIIQVIAFQFLQARIGVLASAEVLAASCLVLAAASLVGLRETYGRDLRFLES